MRIAINASIMDKNLDGVRVFTKNIVNSLISLPESRKHQFTIFSPFTKYFKEGRNIKIVKIPELMLNSKHPKIAPLFRFFWNNLIYTFLVKDFDVSYSTTPHGSLFLKNQIITIHDTTAFHYPKMYRMRHYYFKYLIPLMIKNEEIAIESNSLKKDFAKWTNIPKEKMKVCYLACDTNTFKPNNHKKSRYFLLVGGSFKYKNFENALIAFSILPKDIKKDYSIIIAGGRKEYLDEIETLASTLGIKEKVKIINRYIDQKNLCALYQNAELYIHPSLYEGFGMPPLEAMASGCPVIASNLEIIKEVNDNAAYYFNPKNPNEIKKAIMVMITNEKLRKKFIKNGLKRAKFFSWNSSAKIILKMIERSKK